MGQSSSSAHGADPTLQNPFPVTPHLSSDLDRLSFVAARILNTPDIYNIENLSKMDVCGAYTVFLKQQIKDDLMHSYAKSLKPLSVKLPGEEKVQEVVYNDGSAIKKEEREKICTELAETMVQVISIVVAALASIQVAAPSREVIMRQASPPVLAAPVAHGAPAAAHHGGAMGPIVGGDQDDDNKTRFVIEWFKKNGFLEPGKLTTTENIQMARRLLDPLNPTSPQQPYNLYIEFTKNQATSDRSALNVYAKIIRTNAIEKTVEGFHLTCSFPLNLENNLQGVAIKISGEGSVILTAGILTKEGFITFNTKRWKISDMLNALLTAASKGLANPIETQQSLSDYDRKFKLFSILSPTPEITAEKKKITDELFPQAPQAPPVYPGFAGYPPNPFGFQQPMMPQQQQKRFETVDMTTQMLLSRPQHAPTVSVSAPGQRVINQLRHFNDLIPKQSSPAAVRAITLAGLMDASRAVHTNVCNDPYWTSTPNLSSIYPWATLQFLCLKGITAKTEKFRRPFDMTTDSKKALVNFSQYEFENEWKTSFVDPLQALYSTAPKLQAITKTREFVLPDAAGVPTPATTAAAAVTLDRMKFDAVSDLKVDTATCKESPTPRIQFREVQTAIQKLHHLYNDHVEEVWKLLNSLILIIQDPETKKELVRLHPLAVATGESSLDYVKKKAAEARTMIAKFYVEVETAYLEAARTLKVA